MRSGVSDDPQRWCEDDRNRPLGALVGFVTVTGCHHADECTTRREHRDRHTWIKVRCSPWAKPDSYHWTLADPEPLPEPVPMRGRQKLWRIEGDDLAALGRALAVAEGVTS